MVSPMRSWLWSLRTNGGGAMIDVEIKVLNCISINDVEDICIENCIDVVINYKTDTIVSCSDPRFLQGVIAALMFQI
jgi:hypothetical protein